MKKLLHVELVSLLSVNAVKSCSITADSGVFYLAFDINGQLRTLHTQRGNIRNFTYIDSCISYLHRIGISEAHIFFNQLSSTPRLFS
jgi:hypothetical protein